jgi:hypothetical protein
MRQEQDNRRTGLSGGGMVVYLHDELARDIVKRKRHAGVPNPSVVTYKDLNRYEIREDNHTKRI